MIQHPYKRRTAHSLLWLRRFTAEVKEPTIILCGNATAASEIFDMCWQQAKERGVLFWLPSPGGEIAGGVYRFEHAVLDSSWDRGFYDSDVTEWEMTKVHPHLVKGWKQHNVP